MNLKYRYINTGVKAFIAAILWLVIISVLHLSLNKEGSDRKVVTMGYMPVITNLAAPILDYVSKKGDGVRYKALKFASFAEMAESLRNGEIQAGFMIAPLSIVLRQQGENVRVVIIGNRHESTLVTRKGLNIKKLDDLAGKTIAVPMRYSGHNISILNLLAQKGLQDCVNVVEMNPPDMAAALAAGSLDAYYVGEPFAAQTLTSGDAELLHYVEEVWPDFICNLVVVRDDWIQKEADTAEQMVHGAVRAGIWAKQYTDEAAKIASDYWNQPLELVKYALNTPKNRIVYDKYVPKEEEIQYMVDQMVKLGLANHNDVSGLVYDKFAKSANINDVTSLESILR